MSDLDRLYREALTAQKTSSGYENPYGDMPLYRDHPEMNLLLNKAVSSGNPMETMMGLQTMNNPPEWASDLKERALNSPNSQEDQSIHDELMSRYKNLR